MNGGWYPTAGGKFYQVCLWISVLTILLNIVCVHMVTKPAVSFPWGEYAA